MFIPLEASWEKLLSQECRKKYFSEIENFLTAEIATGKTIYPHPKNIFRAFEYTPVEKLKVVILGQDPYHGEGQAHGLSFSVEDGVKVPPSLKNIFKEIENEGLSSPWRRGAEGEVSGNLQHWAEQGILMLNSILTVESGKPASHRDIGWETFTDAVISTISDNCEGIIFLLWGNFSRGKKGLIDPTKHFILESVHPSPFSARNGFFGNGHFRQVNDILKKRGKEEILW